MHFHRYRNWEYQNDIDMYIDGQFHKTKEIWRARCEVCGKPKRKRVS